MGIVVLVSCSKILPKAPADNDLLDGPMEGLSSEELNRFIRGDKAFNDEIFTQETGLGPLFVTSSCGSCHAGDGKGHPFTALTRFGQSDSTGNHFLQAGGPQLQHRALPGFTPEIIPAAASLSTFMPPATTGLGLLDAIPDAVILALADPEDRDGDGISGKAHYISIPDYCQLRPASVGANGKWIGRFGKKAATYDLLQQTATAYNQDMGITSMYEPIDTYTHQLIDPEVSNTTILDVVFYLKTLKAPLTRNSEDPAVVEGSSLFGMIGCGKCHTPELTTGNSAIPALSNKVFYPYTDLLLHDMGDDLDDGYTEGSALSREWRTPPLWGLGLSPKSQGGQYFLLHDGRAKSIDAAINWHGGEAATTKNKFKQLSEQEKKSLIKFLESL